MNISNDRFLVVDVHIIVHTVTTKTRRDIHAEMRPFWARMGEAVEIKGERVTLRPLISKHIVEQSFDVLGRLGFSQADALAELNAVAAMIRRAGGFVEIVNENYRELANKAFARFGTDAEDEAVLAAAERTADTHGGRAVVAIATNDRDFTSYLNDRKIAVFSSKDVAAMPLVNAYA